MSRESIYEYRSITKANVIGKIPVKPLDERVYRVSDYVKAGMTPEEARSKVEREDGNRSAIPPSTIWGNGTASRAFDIDAPLTREILAILPTTWTYSKDLASVLGLTQRQIQQTVVALGRRGLIEVQNLGMNRAMKYRLTAPPQASGAITMPKTGQTPSGDALVGGKQQAEGKA